MPFGRGKGKEPPMPDPIVEDGGVEDPTAWILNNELANFLLMNTNEIVSLLEFTLNWFRVAFLAFV